MLYISRVLIGLALSFSLSSETAFAKAPAKPAVKQPQPSLIYFKDYKKMKPADRYAYLELLRKAAIEMQAKNPSFAQFIYESFLSDAQAMGPSPAQPKTKYTTKEKAKVTDVVPIINQQILDAEKTDSIPAAAEEPKTEKAKATDVVPAPYSNRINEAEKPLYTDPVPTLEQVENDSSPVNDNPTLKCSTKGGCNVVNGNAFELRCFYGGFAIGKNQSGKNSCSPVTGNICDANNPFNRDTRPKLGSFENTVCKMNPDAGKCVGADSTINSKSSKNMIVCNPHLYGLINNGNPDPSKAHVICVPYEDRVNASKECETRMSEFPDYWVQELSRMDNGEGFNQTVTAMENSCAKGLKWDASSKSFVDNGNMAAMTEGLSDINNATDFQQTCVRLMNQVARLKEIGGGDPIIKDGASRLGIQ